jgi:hypothetical protein
MARRGRRLELTARACLAFLGAAKDVLGQTKEITQLMCKDLSGQSAGCAMTNPAVL